MFNLAREYPSLNLELRKAIASRCLQCGYDSRALAWPLLLGISKETPLLQLYKEYLQDAFDLTKSSIKDVSTQK